MGKASRWFRGLLGLNKPDNPHPNPTPVPKKKWSFVKSYKDSQHDHHHKNKLATAADYKSHYGNFSGSLRNDAVADHHHHPTTTYRAITVAEATAVVAEAAIAAANAAAAVVKLTSTSGRAATSSSASLATTWPNGAAVSSSAALSSARCVDGSGGAASAAGSREAVAAVVIQSHFRGYLSRRALRALKGLVKLQALVRGHIVRKQTSDMLRVMQALIRAQSRARAGRSQLSESPSSSSKSIQFLHPSPRTPENFEHVIQARSIKHDDNFMLKRISLKSNSKVIDPEKVRISRAARSLEPHGSSARTSSMDEEKSDKILEIDTGKPYVTPKERNHFHSSQLSLNSDQYSYSLTTSKDSTARQTVPSPLSCGGQSSCHLKFNEDHDDSCFCTADSSPQFYSASSKGGSSRRGPFTPTKSDGSSKSHLSGYSDHPNYMSYTESAKAKLRSMSAPKQRPQYERSSSTKRYSVHGYGESRTNSQKDSAIYAANFASKAYPGSGRLDRLGMPVKADFSGFSGGIQHRY